jgi:hypothetical protein
MIQSSRAPTASVWARGRKFFHNRTTILYQQVEQSDMAQDHATLPVQYESPFQSLPKLHHPVAIFGKQPG